MSNLETAVSIIQTILRECDVFDDPKNGVWVDSYGFNLLFTGQEAQLLSEIAANMIGAEPPLKEPVTMSDTWDDNPQYGQAAQDLFKELLAQRDNMPVAGIGSPPTIVGGHAVLAGMPSLEDWQPESEEDE